MQRSRIFYRYASRVLNLRSASSQLLKKIPCKSSFHILPNEEAAKFSAYFPRIVNDIVDYQLVTNEPEVNRRIRNILNYNIPKGKHVTPHIIIYCYKFMEEEISNNNLTSEKADLVNKLAWCWETMNSMLLIMDDIIDGAELRRNQKAWYRLEGVQVWLDVLLLQSCYLKLLEKYFSEHVNYAQIVKTFSEAIMTAAVGETIQHQLRNFDCFTVSNFRKIAQYKSVPIRIDAPFRLACLLSNQKDFLSDHNCQNILTELGILYQIQNDFHDCYGESILGKVGNDIEKNLCSIMIATALQKASTEQRNMLKDSYGQPNREKVDKVKQIYQDLDMEIHYQDLETESCRYICDELVKIEDNKKKKLMRNLSAFFFGENKHHILRS